MPGIDPSRWRRTGDARDDSRRGPVGRHGDGEDHGSVGLQNQTGVAGFFDRVTGALALQGSFVAADGSRVDFGLQGATTTFPPSAVPMAPSTVECTQPKAAIVHLDGSASQSGAPIASAWWTTQPNKQLGVGLVVDAKVPYGSNFVEFNILDVAGSSDSEYVTVNVVDTTPPRFTSVPLPVTTADCTSSPNLGQPTAVDDCDNGVVITNNAPSQFPLGNTVVTWTARDSLGNTATVTQMVTVSLGDNPACCPAGTNVVVLTSNNDVFTGTPGNDCILGRGGQDQLSGGGGNDLISGGEGDDILNGGTGADRLFGGGGQDTVNGDDGNDQLSGGGGDDRLNGGKNNDLLSGGQGQDRLFGGDGNDTLSGGDGDDTLEGGAGDDFLDGSGLHDQCIGGPGSDILVMCQNGQS